MTGIDRSAAPEIFDKGVPDAVPAMLLGRLAVDHSIRSTRTTLTNSISTS